MADEGFFAGFMDDYFAECEEHLAAIRRLLLVLDAGVGRQRVQPDVLDDGQQGLHQRRHRGFFLCGGAARRPSGRRGRSPLRVAGAGSSPALGAGLRPRRHARPKVSSSGRFMSEETFGQAQWLSQETKP